MALEAWFIDIEPAPLREWRESIVPIHADPGALRIWSAFWDLQPDRPLIVLPMGGAIRDRITSVAKDAWFTRRGFVPESEEEDLIRSLWSAMERVQSEIESSKSGSGDS